MKVDLSEDELEKLRGLRQHAEWTGDIMRGKVKAAKDRRAARRALENCSKWMDWESTLSGLIERAQATAQGIAND